MATILEEAAALLEMGAQMIDRDTVEKLVKKLKAAETLAQDWRRYGGNPWVHDPIQDAKDSAKLDCADELEDILKD